MRRNVFALCPTFHQKHKLFPACRFSKAAESFVPGRRSSSQSKNLRAASPVDLPQRRQVPDSPVTTRSMSKRQKLRFIRGEEAKKLIFQRGEKS